MCKTCTHGKADVCKHKGDYEAAKAALQQPRDVTFEAVLRCKKYAVDQWGGDVIIPSRDLPDAGALLAYGPNPGVLDRYYKAHC
jgi:hypothetical protein